MTYVESTVITSISYSRANKILKVQFQNGDCWQYTGVSRRKRDRFVAAPSKGAFLNQVIKPHYTGQKVAS